ncbi:Methionine synthase [Candidatus Hodgkinia cicadicola]|nr:Methionine synthase [Candidatus Hodgkinia cicadicola]
MFIGEIKTNGVYKAILKVLNNKVLILDGAMGTQIQKYKLKNKHYITRLRPTKIQKGNNDILNITQPKLIEKIHTDYIKAGSDIIETNTFSSNMISQLDYQMQDKCIVLNKYGVLIARRASLKQAFCLNKRIFAIGSIGPTNKTASMSPDVLRPSYRSTTFDELALTYENQIQCLFRNKVDAIIIETIFDTLNAKAAIYAYYNVCLKARTKYPIMLSATISDNSGRTLSGQTVGAFWTSVEHANPLCIGLNCALGADKLKPYVSQLASIASAFICAYPNAGLPNEFGEYDETPQQFANKIKEYIDGGLVNVIGGCCGSNPMHIAMLKKISAGAKPRKKPHHEQVLKLSGMNSLTAGRNTFNKIGERANVTGSAKFKKLIVENEYEKILDIIREQIRNGASIIDINVDEALLDSEREIKELVNLIGAEPDISKTPLMIDSSNWSVILAGIKCTQGKCIINSISLKDGETEFLKKAQVAKMCGSAIIVMAFDELGQANTAERRLQICFRAWTLLKKVSFKLQDVIFDLNTFAIATGLYERNNCAKELIKSIRLVSALLPAASMSVGVSNLSFSFRGNSNIRESLHSVFLLHAIKAGLNFGIINVNNQINANNLDVNVRSLCERLLLTTEPVSVDKVLTVFGRQRCAKQAIETEETWRKWDLKSKLVHAVINGVEKYIENDSIQLSSSYSPITIIEGPLMEGMNIVGKLFGEGKMFLPQVVKSARVMKKAVQALTPLLKKLQSHVTHTILLATVKGDVHDIGKNIVGIVLSCNNYKIIDLGIMVSAEEIVKSAISTRASIIGLSGLITPSLDEMINVARKLQEQKISAPLLIGGATTSKIHTAVKIYPEYLNGITVHVTNASKAVTIVAQLLSKQKLRYINNIKNEYELIATTYSKSKLKENKIEYERVLKLKAKLTQKQLKTPLVLGSKLNLLASSLPFYIASRLKDCVQTWYIENPTQNEIKTDIAQNKTISKTLNLIKIINAEKWFNVRCNTLISKTYKINQQILILDKINNPVDKLPTLSQQHTDSEYLSLGDFISNKLDYISTFCCSISYESVLIQKFFKKIGRQHLANVFKSICDKTVEECSTLIFNNVRHHFWGFLDNFSNDLDEGEKAGIRPAPGYPICPDHHIKLKITKLLKTKEKTGLIVNNRHLMSPQSSIVALIVSNKTSLYFNIRNVNADQVSAYSNLTKLSVQNLEKTLSTIIGYIPSYIEQ